MAKRKSPLQGFSENDIIIMVRTENDKQDGKIEKVYLRKAAFNELVAEWKPYIAAVKWLVTAILIAFAGALVALVFTSLKS